MAKNVANVHSYADALNGVWTGIAGTAQPSQTANPVPGVWPTGMFEIGWITDNGLSGGIDSYQETKKYAWQGGYQISELRNQATWTLTGEMAEENAVTMGLARPNAPVTTTGATAEVQTVTFTGTGTAGTWSLSNIGYGGAILTGLAYNVPTTTLATALTNLGIGTFTVSGSAGSSYVVTFPTNLGNVPVMAVAQAITGVTGASVATTTPGVTGVNVQPIRPNLARNLRVFGVDLVTGTLYRKIVLTQTELKITGTPKYVANDNTVYPFTLTAYPDSALNGDWGYEINNDPNRAQGLFV